MKRLILISTLIFSFFVNNASAEETLIWTAGPVGGGWYTMASGMAKLIMEENPDLTVKVVPGGGITNPAIIDKGLSELGFSLDVFSGYAYRGEEVYKAFPRKNITMIGASFSDNFTHFLQSEGSDLTLDTILQVANGSSIGITQAGSTDESMFRKVMEIYGTNYDRMRDEQDHKVNLASYADLASQYKDGQTDHIFLNLGLPGGAIIDMMLGREGRIMSLPDDLIDALNQEYGFNKGVIPAGTYPNQPSDVATIRMGTVIMVHADQSEDSVYKITKTFCEQTEKLIAIHSSMTAFNCSRATENAPIPVHPGAMKYYREKGYVQ
jgi:uncharacterized protein